jgi:predicted nucleic acid-binding protein
MKPIFVDTSGVYAILVNDDINHKSSLAVWAEIARSPMVTNNYVVVETLAILQNRVGLPAARSFANDLLPLMQIDWITELRQQAAVEAMLASGRKLSVVDCASFQTMRDYGIRAAFTFDSHFREQGFEMIP